MVFCLGNRCVCVLFVLGGGGGGVCVCVFLFLSSSLTRGRGACAWSRHGDLELTTLLSAALSCRDYWPPLLWARAVASQTPEH